MLVCFITCCFFGTIDIAVGAPFAVQGGFVIVLYGSKDGIYPKLTQLIPSTFGFGFSLSGGLDLDNNGINGSFFSRTRGRLELEILTGNRCCYLIIVADLAVGNVLSDLAEVYWYVIEFKQKFT